ncbi:related to ariadne-2 protein [Rhynchosporium graminicola]|uniref:Related to ariadne-2 protein n=1 Tax=Rhynchosporium graminicola TaxID=2792576 RepID=A0A1E1K1L6_9HELO|nr:related to ariadne-2 protein [Rhynchosporium commune]
MLTPQQVDPDIASPDSRATIPCMFLSRPRGCQNSSCPYLHVVNAPAGAKDSGQDLEANIEEEDQEHGDDFIRNLLGATVCFGEFGHTLKVSFPSDFSLVCITGLVPGTTTEDFVEVLREFGYDLTAECVRISKLVGSSEPKATVKVEDPLFAQGLCSKLKTQRSNLKAAPIPINARLLSCRKVYISWHKPTRSVWVNFGSGEVANRVAQKFRDGRYKCLGQSVESSLGKCSPGRGGQRASSNPSAWTIILSDVPSNSTSRDIEEAIKSQYDKPRHVELGPCSYQASDAEISVIVRTQLEEHGLLESFYLASTNKGKRTKATALFADEADAKSACVLKNRPLDILGKGKITITMIQSVKIKVSTPVYIATKSEIDVRIKGWKERRLGLHAYPDAIQRFTTLKVEGDSAQDVANARKTLDQILSGIILRTGDSVVWDSSLSSNGNAYKKVKSIAKELHVLIIRNKTQRQLQYYGPIAKVQDIVNQVTDMIREEPSTNRDIQQHQDTIIKGNQASEVRPMLEIASAAEGKCPICLDDEPDTPIQTLCKHSYCFECFENCCRSAASTNKEEFRVECQGDGGNCTVVFKLAELKDHLSSSAFELVLQSSFEEYIQKHLKDFHYCPTPDCGYVYRCTPVSSFKPTAYRCPNCLEPICTFCHARHGDYTCAQYQDIESGGYEALEKLKKELNIKDCPTCKTSMEKTEGCNHITCGGCRAHICWVCMAVFRTSGPCYDHMREQHGSIGLEDLDHYLADW